MQWPPKVENPYKSFLEGTKKETIVSQGQSIQMNGFEKFLYDSQLELTDDDSEKKHHLFNPTLLTQKLADFDAKITDPTKSQKERDAAQAEKDKFEKDLPSARMVALLAHGQTRIATAKDRMEEIRLAINSASGLDGEALVKEFNSKRNLVLNPFNVDTTGKSPEEENKALLKAKMHGCDLLHTMNEIHSRNVGIPEKDIKNYSAAGEDGRGGLHNGILIRDSDEQKLLVSRNWIRVYNQSRLRELMITNLGNALDNSPTEPVSALGFWVGVAMGIAYRSTRVLASQERDRHLRNREIEALWEKSNNLQPPSAGNTVNIRPNTPPPVPSTQPSHVVNVAPTVPNTSATTTTLTGQSGTVNVTPQQSTTTRSLPANTTSSSRRRGTPPPTVTTNP